MKPMNIGIRCRLGVAFSLLLVLLAGVAASGLHSIARIEGISVGIVSADYRKTFLLERIKEAGTLNWSNSLRTMLATDESEMALIDGQMEEISRSNMARREELATLLRSKQEQDAYAELEKARIAYADARQGAMEMLADRDQRSAGYAMLQGAVAKLFERYNAAIGKLLTIQQDSMRAGTDDIRSAGRQARLLSITVATVALLLGITLAWRIARSVAKPLREAVGAVEAVARGDLTVSFRSGCRDEVGRLLNSLETMRENLTRVIGQIRVASESVSSASSEIAAGNADLAQRTSGQACSVEQTASSMKALTSTVKQNADNARQANQLATRASEIAARGGTVVGDVVRTMDGINDSSKKIADIIGVIDGIAFQTNILALNAAVEAARAGEQGRGFAVVASEVRNLAQRSAGAAKEIKELIADSVCKTEAGAALVARAGSTMDEVVSSVRRVTDIMAAITAATAEQSSRIELVNLAVAQMDTVTQQNAALVEEEAAATQSLDEQARRLAEAVAAFRLAGGVAIDPAQAEIERGQAAATVPPVAPKPTASTASPATKAKSRPVLAPKLAAKAKAGADDEWAEF